MEKNKSLDSDLPISKEKMPLAQRLKAGFPKIVDNTKRALKVAGYGLGAAGLLTVSIIGNSIISALSFVGGVACLTASVKTVALKKYPSLMFSQSRLGKETKINQDASIADLVRLSSYNTTEKGSLMALQSLVGLSRIKDELKNSSYSSIDGQRVYAKKFSTVTHGINIKNMHKLQDLGYIKIDSIEDLTSISGKPKKSLLIFEKIGFGNFRDIRDIIKASLSGDKEKLESMKRKFSKISFRITDKPLDLEELYSKFNGHTPYRDLVERSAIRRFAPILDKNHGLFATKNLDLKQDRFGRTIIDYNPEKSFIQRMNEKYKISARREEKSFDERIRDVELGKDINPVSNQNVRKEISETQDISK